MIRGPGKECFQILTWSSVGRFGKSVNVGVGHLELLCQLMSGDFPSAVQLASLPALVGVVGDEICCSILKLERWRGTNEKGKQT
jgi:hypothetical protein